MSFIDKASVIVRAGDGGDGHVSFRHEKFIDKGGPDGGDGGHGGDVIFAASRNQNTLASFRFQKELVAASGVAGGKQRKAGRSGADLLVAVPVGTVVIGEDGKILADLAQDGQQATIAKGGQGGFGNAHFVSSTRQAPKIAEKGEPGEAMELQLELKIIADVGLIGMPNAGKSTLLSVISGARPEIANYPVTTLIPNLGVADVDATNSLLVADIPGLIEGAAQGKGLGDEFLRHVERTAVLVHLIDAYQNDIAQAYQTIQTELKAYKVDLSTRPQIVALTKIEGLDDDIVQDQLQNVKKLAPKAVEVTAISAQTGQGVKELLYRAKQIVDAERAKAEVRVKEAEGTDGLPVIGLPASAALPWKVKKTSNGFMLSGAKIERFARRTDFTSEEGVRRIRDIMKKMGIIHELRRQGVDEGSVISFRGSGSFKY